MYVMPEIYVSVLMHFLDHEWKNTFFIHCLTPVLEAMVAVDVPSYSRFMSLDKLVRDFSVPALLDEKYIHSASPRFLVMQRALVSTGRDIGEFYTFRSLKRPLVNAAISSASPTSPPLLYRSDERARTIRSPPSICPVGPRNVPRSILLNISD